VYETDYSERHSEIIGSPNVGNQIMEKDFEVNCNSSPVPLLLTEENMAHGLQFLSERDLDLAHVLKNYGSPPMWTRRPGFPTLVHIILEQQVSLASAKATYQRVLATITPLTPDRFLALEDTALKTIGFSRQKLATCQRLAEAIVERRLDLSALGMLDDFAVRSELTKIKGIGRWTADIYLLLALSRADTWPSGDLGLALAVQEVKGLTARPTPNELDALSMIWQPWRAVATRLFWHYYLSKRSRSYV
jgi:DNA-3-methyladenine glycosylase II